MVEVTPLHTPSIALPELPKGLREYAPLILLMRDAQKCADLLADITVAYENAKKMVELVGPAEEIPGMIVNATAAQDRAVVLLKEAQETYDTRISEGNAAKTTIIRKARAEADAATEAETARLEALKGAAQSDLDAIKARNRTASDSVRKAQDDLRDREATLAKGQAKLAEDQETLAQDQQKMKETMQHLNAAIAGANVNI